MGKQKLNYKIGDIIAVPMKNMGGYVAGLVTHFNGKGKMLVFYFEDYYKKIDEIDLLRINLKKYLFIQMTDDLGLLNQEWKNLGSLPNYNQNEWAMPNFVRIDDISQEYYSIEYDNQCREIGMQKVSQHRTYNMPEDGYAGYGFVEKKLERILKEKMIQK